MYSEVTKMQNLPDGNYYACKQMKQHFESIEQVNNLWEIQALRRLNPHPNILTLHKVVFDRKSGSLALTCKLMDMNIYEGEDTHYQGEKKITYYMYQLCKSLDHMHRNGIFHRDVKPEDILIRQDVLRLGDFRSWQSFYSKQPYMEYTSIHWYRAPECLLTDGFHSYTMDLWSAGCMPTRWPACSPSSPEPTSWSRSQGSTTSWTHLRSRPSPSSNSPELWVLISLLKMDQGYLYWQPSCPRNASPSCMEVVAYEPEERITAHQALHTPTCRSRGPLRSKLWPGTGERPPALLSERPMAPELLSNTWQTAPEGRKQKQPSGGLRRTTSGDRDRPTYWSCPGPSCLQWPSLPRTPARHCSQCSPEGAAAVRPLKCVREAQTQTRRRTSSPPWNSTAGPRQSGAVGLLSAVAPAPARGAPAPGSRAGGSGGLASCHGRDPCPRTCTQPWPEAAGRPQLYCVFQSNTSVKPPHSRVLFHFHNVGI